MFPRTSGVEFRFVEGFPDYCVGDDGSVWSKRSSKSWVRIGTVSGDYHMVTLCRNDCQRDVNVHVLVLETFVGSRPEGMEARHLDGNPHHDHRSNLAWGTNQENQNDRLRHGTVPRGEGCFASKLTEQQVLEIRRLCSEGVSQIAIGRMFNISDVQVANIRKRRDWQHI